MLPQGLDVRTAILQQCGKGGSLMIMGDFPARPAPEPLDPIGVGIVGRGVNDAQMALGYPLKAGHRYTTMVSGL